MTPADLEVLFGPGAKLTKMKDLYQEGEFASEQLVTIVGPRQRIIPNVRILGPARLKRLGYLGKALELELVDDWETVDEAEDELPTTELELVETLARWRPGTADTAGGTRSSGRTSPPTAGPSR